MTLDKLLSGFGRFFIGAGLIVFLFVAYQLWGTNIAEARSQNQLQDEAAELFAAANATPETTAAPAPGEEAPATTVDTTPAPPPAPTGAAVAVIKIPKIGLTKAVVEGTSVDDLKKAPGHYSSTPLPGQPGNSAIAGHRTTYGAPFGDIDRLEVGDEIDVTTRQGTFVYIVSDKQVVSPTETSVLNPTNDNRLTLTTCHPKFSAAQRLIITAMLAPGATAAPAPPPTTTPPTTAVIPGEETTPTTASPIPADEQSLTGESLSGDPTAKGPAVMWGFIAAISLALVWGAGRLFRRVPAYILGGPVFLVALFVFFENFARLLPANA